MRREQPKLLLLNYKNTLPCPDVGRSAVLGAVLGVFGALGGKMWFGGRPERQGTMRPGTMMSRPNLPRS